MITRRQFLAGTTATGVLALSQSETLAVDYAKPAEEAAGLTAYHNGSNILVRLDNQPVLAYRAHPTLKYPYFCPLNGPVSGLSLTTESALPYPHHRGLWLGCEPLNGGDYWSDGPLERGQILSTQLALGEIGEIFVTFTDKCEWTHNDRIPLTDKRSYRVTIPNDRMVLLDCDFELHAQTDIRIKRAKHSFFAMRAAPDISPTYGGVLLNSEGGVGAEETYGQPARWCGYHGRRKLHPDVVEGIAIMNHPNNFSGDCPWFTRDYGHLSPSPFNFLDGEAWPLEQGEQLKLSYRVVLHGGTPQEAGLDSIYEEWLAS